MMRPRARKLALIAHITVTLGWLGAVGCFLALAVIGLTADSEQTARAAYLVMRPAAWMVLVPLALASFATGLVSSLGTVWGLFRHYWVVFKLTLTTFATLVLILYMETFAALETVAADRSAPLSAVRSTSPLLHSALALVLLLVVTVLGVYKPRGVTSYGRRKQIRA